MSHGAEKNMMALFGCLTSNVRALGGAACLFKTVFLVKSGETNTRFLSLSRALPINIGLLSIFRLKSKANFLDMVIEKYGKEQ